MKKLLCIIMLIAFTISLYSSAIIDSLENKLKVVVAEEKVKVLNTLSSEYLFIAPEQSINYCELAAELAIKFNDQFGEHKAYNCAANAYAVLKDYENAIKYLELALQKSEQIGDVELILNDIYRIADVYSSNKNHTKSIEYYNKALKINEITNNRNDVSLTLNRIGLEYKKAGNYKKASEFFIKALKFEEENVRVLMRDEYKQISEFYSARGDDEKALKYYKLFTSMKDTIAYEERSQTISALQQKYDLEQKKRKIELLKKEKEIRDLELQQLTLQQEKQAKEFEAKQRLQQIEALNKDKQLKEYQLKMVSFQRDQIQEKIDSYQKNKEIRELELENRAAEIRSRRFTQQVLMYAVIFIAIFAIVSTYFAITNIKTSRKLKNAYNKLEQIAKTDPLTNLSNRRDMIEKIMHEQTRFSRNGNPFVLVMSDIDDFKKVNDDNGHDCGDFILETLADQMRSSVRKQDIIGRWGGEEFLMLLPETEIDGGVSLAEKIRKDIEVTSYVFNKKELNITMTFGVSVYDRPMNIDQCIKMADEALYEGKKKGKNCVVMSKPEEKPIITKVNKAIESN